MAPGLAVLGGLYSAVIKLERTKAPHYRLRRGSGTGREMVFLYPLDDAFQTERQFYLERYGLGNFDLVMYLHISYRFWDAHYMWGLSDPLKAVLDAGGYLRSERTAVGVKMRAKVEAAADGCNSPLRH